MESVQLFPSKAYSFVTEHKQVSAAVCTTLIAIGLLALLGLILTQTGGLQTLLDKCHVVLSTAQKFNILVASSAGCTIGFLPPLSLLVLYAIGYSLAGKEKHATSEASDHPVDIDVKEVEESAQSDIEATPHTLLPFPPVFQVHS